MTIGQLEMSLDSHWIVAKQRQLSKPIFNRFHPKRNWMTPAIAVISSLVGRSAKPWQARGGQLQLQLVGGCCFDQLAGRPDHGAGSSDTSISSFSDLVSSLFYPPLLPVASARSASCWWLTPPPTPPSPPSPPPYFWPSQPPCT